MLKPNPQTISALLVALLLLCSCNDNESELEKLALNSAETGAAGCRCIMDGGSILNSPNYDEFQKKFIAAIRKGCEE